MARNSTLLEELADALNALEGVFSTPQWGGRAYKVRLGPSGGFKLLARVTVEGRAVRVGFKLAPDRALAVIERHDWIEPSSFRTLAPAGWVAAEFTTKRQLAVVKRLLAESRGLYGSSRSSEPKPQRRDPGSGASARHLDQVMKDARDKGWSPSSDW